MSPRPNTNPGRTDTPVRLGTLQNNEEVETVVRECERNGMISNATEFFTSCQEGTNASLRLYIVLKHSESWGNKMSCIQPCGDFTHSFCDLSNPTYCPSFVTTEAAHKA
jgi:hypothetical protein